jgi:hypothetical protein
MSDDTFALTHPVVGRDGGDKLDYYPTPRWCTELLFEHAYKVDDRWPDARSVLDPAAGDGAILDVARERGFSTYGLELDPVRAEAARSVKARASDCSSRKVARLMSSRDWR